MAARPVEGPTNRRRHVLLGTVVLASAALSFGFLQAEQSVTASSQFRVATLEVRGLRLLTGGEVLQQSGVLVGDGLFDIDLDAVAERLNRLVWVRAARVERKPPDRLIVHLEERRRVAWIEYRQRQHGIDVDGVLLPPDRLSSEGIADLDLPVMRVPLPGDSLVVGQVVADNSVQRLLAWWSQAREVAPELVGDISQFETYDNDALVLRLVADNLEIRLPFGQVRERLATLREVLGRVYSECPNPVYVDLRFAGQAVVGRQPAATMMAPQRETGRSREMGSSGDAEGSSHG
ncbi:MAG: FtsQ-type POTRA domain-containing protein [bacterium]|nr:FtsQ-type POTRA domain-containing protein [bacterium]